eukprot:6431267-Alexandrium_andersonii.AAC.1
MLGSDGLFSYQALPDTAGIADSSLAASAFSYTLLDNTGNSGKGKGKPTRKPGRGGGKGKGGKDAGTPGGSNGDGVQVPNTPLHEANNLCTDILKKASEAQKLWRQIEPLGFSSDMVNYLKKFHKACMGIHNRVWPLVVKKVDDEQQYVQWHATAKTLLEMYEGRRKLAASMANAAKPKKAKAEAEVPEESEMGDLDGDELSDA